MGNLNDRRKRMRYLVALGALALLSSMVPTAEVSAHGGNTSLVHACVNKSGGVRIVQANSTCRSQETALDWPQSAGGGGGIVLKDASGTLVGPFDGGAVYLNSPDGLVEVHPHPTDLVGFGGDYFIFYYTSNNCSGQRMASPPDFKLFRQAVGVISGTLFYTPTSGSTLTINSWEWPGGCLSGPFTSTFGPVGTLDISGFVPPFHVEVLP